jgi:hypothetical protein
MSNSVNKSSCDACQFCVADMAEKQLVLKCRRYPPVANAIPVQTQMGMGVQVMSLNPQVSKNDWCGEFKVKEVSVKLIS